MKIFLFINLLILSFFSLTNSLKFNQQEQQEKQEKQEQEEKEGEQEDELKWYLNKLKSHETGSFLSSKIHILRLKPNEDLLESLFKYSRIKKIKALSIISAVGSLIQTNIRYANQENTVSLKGYFEIVSLVGNIDYQQVNNPNYSPSGHIHISCSNENGQTIGGHLQSGNIVYTTVELTLLEIQDAIFDRALDDISSGGSGYYELKVYNTTS